MSSGSGYGYGDGDGYGSGSGDGLPSIAGYYVIAYRPFAVLAIGCETHSVAEWRARWREIANDNDEPANDALGEAIEAACREAEAE